MFPINVTIFMFINKNYNVLIYTHSLIHVAFTSQFLLREGLPDKKFTIFYPALAFFSTVSHFTFHCKLLGILIFFYLKKHISCFVPSK